MNKKEELNADSQDNRESRREMLLKIGAALAVASVPLESNAQVKPKVGQQPQLRTNVVRIPDNIRSVIAANAERQQFQVFFAHPKGEPTASVLVVKASDQNSSREAAALLKAGAATATVVGGIVHINLGNAAAGRCFGSAAAGAIDFRGGGPVEKLGSLVRQ